MNKKPIEYGESGWDKKRGDNEMNSIIIGLGVFVFVFLGTFLGGGSLQLLKDVVFKRRKLVLLFSGGIILSLLLNEIIPEAIELFETKGIILGFIAGALLMKITDQFFHKGNKKSFMFLVVALILHNLPTGVGVGLLINESSNSIFSSPFLLAMFFHHIPEGLALMSSALYGNVSFYLFTLTCLILAFFFGISALIGNAFLYLQNIKVNTLLMGTSIGTLSFVTLHEFLRKSKDVTIFEWLLYTSFGFLIPYSLLFIH
jgi:zinc transporter, ZIP family